MTEINDITDLVQILQDNPGWRDTVRSLIVGEELGKLPEEMAVFVRTTNENFTLVHQQFEKVHQQFEKVHQRLERLETDLNSLRKDTRREFNNVNGRLDNGFGTNYEHKVTKNIPSHVRQKLDLRRVRMLRSIRDGLTTELEDFLDNAKNYDLMTKEQFGELLDADLILTGRHADSDINTYVVAEMAIRIRQDDITRAANRAEIFRNATDSPVISAAIGARINPKEAKLADEMNVTTLLIPE